MREKLMLYNLDKIISETPMIDYRNQNRVAFHLKINGVETIREDQSKIIKLFKSTIYEWINRK